MNMRLKTKLIKDIPASSKYQSTIDGLPVKNLDKKIKLIISERDCSKGKSKEPNACAAALAAVRQVPHCSEARVHINRIFLKIGKVWFRGKIPNSLRSEIVSFDRGGSFAPGEYSINPLSPSEMPTGKRTGAKDKTNRETRRGKPKRIVHFLVGVRESARSEYRK